MAWRMELYHISKCIHTIKCTGYFFTVPKYSFVYQMFVLADWEHLNKGLFLGVSLVTLISTLIASTVIFERMELK